MFPSRLPIDNNQETVPLSPRPFIKTGLAAEESDSSIYIRGANMKRYRLFQNIGLLTAMSFALVSCFKDELVGSRVNSRSNIIGFGISAATTADGSAAEARTPSISTRLQRTIFQPWTLPWRHAASLSTAAISALSARIFP